MTRPATSRLTTTFSRLVSGALLAFGLLLGQMAGTAPARATEAPLCTPFGAETAGLSGWGACTGAPNIVVTTSTAGNPTGDASDYFLHLRDTSGPSAACSTDERYLGDWNARMGECGTFCFDFKVFKSGTPPGPITPSFTIWSGPLKASFVANFTVTTNDPWVHICAPVNRIDAGANLPSGASGQWRIAPTGNAYSPDWNSIVTSVTMVQLPIDFTSDPSEEAGYDNFCMNPDDCSPPPPPPPERTGCLKDAGVEIVCNDDGTLTLTLTDTYDAGAEIALSSETPGILVTPPVQAAAATTSWTISGATAGEAVTLFATRTVEGKGSEPGTDQCCSGEIEFVVPDCPPPIDVKIDKELLFHEGPHANFELIVTNVGAPITYGPGDISVTDSVPAGMTILGLSAPGWTCSPIIPPPLVGPALLTCANTLGGSVGTGGQIGSTIALNAIGTESGALENCAAVGLASDTDPDNDKDCVTIGTPIEGRYDIGIEKTGGTSPAPQVRDYAFHLTVTNHGDALTGGGTVQVSDVVPFGMTFDGASGTDWSCNAPPALAAGQTLICTYTGTGTIGTGTALPPIDIVAHAIGEMPFPPVTNCTDTGFSIGSGLSDSDASNDHDCVTVSKPQTEIIDLGLDKTGGSVPGPVGAALDYTLSVTNLGAAFTGTNIVTVTDTVPSGVTITIAGGTDWTCTPLPVTGPAGFTCTYLGSGPATTGDPLPPISVTGIGTGDGPYQNCADVAIDPGSGLSEIDVGNNQDCVTVPGNEVLVVAPPPPPPPPLVCDPRTAKADGTGCACRYPDMKQTSPISCACSADSKLVSGKGCVVELVCKAPRIANSSGTACVCAGDKIFKNGKCVTPEPKKPPKLVCPEGTALNKAGTACIAIPRPKPTLPKIILPKGIDLQLPDLDILFPKGGSNGKP